MKRYCVQVIGPNPIRYRGLLAADVRSAIIKAEDRHQAVGYPFTGNRFEVVSSHTVVCGSVGDSEIDTVHMVGFTDLQLAEIEAALRDRIGFLEARVDVAQYGKPTPALRAYKTHLAHTRAALDLVGKA